MIFIGNLLFTFIPRGRTGMAFGVVKWFNTNKGFGFIDPDDGDKDIFFHITAVQESGLETVNEGQRLEFELHQRGDGRTMANELKVVE